MTVTVPFGTTVTNISFIIINNNNTTRNLSQSMLYCNFIVNYLLFRYFFIKLPVWVPPVPRVLNSGGSVLDLNPEGNADVGSLDEVMADAENETVDPATLAIQDVCIEIQTILSVYRFKFD